MLKYIIWGWLSGGLIAIQAITNGAMNERMGSAIWTVAVLMALASLATLVMAFITSPQQPVLLSLPAIPYWAYLGGLVVAFYMFTITQIVPQVGLAFGLLAVIFGQLSFSLAIEHFGWFGVAQQPFEGRRIIGIVLVLAGVYLVKR